MSSVVGVSQLYMEMSGIVAFKYTPGQDSSLLRDPLLVDKAAYFRKHPMFLHLGRPLMDKGYKATVTQIFIDCLARNSFVKLATNLIENHEVRFIAVKNFLSGLSHAKENKLEDLVTAANEGKNPTDQQRAIVKGCHVFVKEMFNDCIKNPYIITERKKTDYLSVGGTAAQTTEFLFQGEEDTCRAYLKELNKYFKTTTKEKEVCLVDYSSIGDSYVTGYFDDNMNKGFYGNSHHEYNSGKRDHRAHHVNSISNYNYNNHRDNTYSNNHGGYDSRRNTNNNRRYNTYSNNHGGYDSRRNTNNNRNNGGHNTYNKNYQSRRGNQEFE
ncbi:hypothetical protein EB796_007868 [Bugula neritina]|uniref:Uncharacterized protein n=1 Tax=Bugula neritina TaxID=10212 RepID=A0A7J7K7C1_BUGNE|nr:hypothetical protein EB796_007868 [Bugula neritina]